MVRPTLKKQIPNLQEAIKETAWKQAAEYGAAALSLRAIARELKITAPAIYNYFSSRDDLVTALIVDAYTSLGDAQFEVIRTLLSNDHKKHLIALGIAYYQWANSHLQRYQLIFGTPIPNYHAPEAITLPAAARSLEPLIEELRLAFKAGQLRTEKVAQMSPKLMKMCAELSETRGDTSPEVAYLAIVIWSRLHGLVSLELGHHLPSQFQGGELIINEINLMIGQLFNEI